MSLSITTVDAFANRPFAGNPAAVGNFTVSLVATDGGLPPLSVTNIFTMAISPALNW